MLNYYGLITTNLLIIYLLANILAFLPKRLLWTSITIFILIANTIVIYNSSTIANKAFGFIAYLSISSVIFLIITIADRFKQTQANLAYTSLALLIPSTIFYIIFFISSYYLYDLGFEYKALILTLSFTYAITLLAISKKFIVFNCIILLASTISFTNFLGLNIWNYLLDPTLIIICCIELTRCFILKIKSCKK